MGRHREDSTHFRRTLRDELPAWQDEGLITAEQSQSLSRRYALDGLPNKVMAAEYRTALPDEALIAQELDRARRRLDARRPPRPPSRPAPRAAARSFRNQPLNSRRTGKEIGVIPADVGGSLAGSAAS